jgi:hypothetical protein
VKVRQYAYFGIRSDTLEPHVVTTRLGFEPDNARRKGSRQPGPPPAPRVNLWDVASGLLDTEPLDAHFDALLTRLMPHTDSIKRLLADGEATGVLQVVRFTEPGPEDEAIIEPTSGPDWERLGGQHPLLGFHLNTDVLRLAVDLGVEIDFDEYGDEHE